MRERAGARAGAGENSEGVSLSASGGWEEESERGGGFSGRDGLNSNVNICVRVGKCVSREGKGFGWV